MEGVLSPGLSLSCLQNCYAHIDSADNTWSREASFLSFCHPLPYFSAQKGKHATGAGYLSLPRRNSASALSLCAGQDQDRLLIWVLLTSTLGRREASAAAGTL